MDLDRSSKQAKATPIQVLNPKEISKWLRSMDSGSMIKSTLALSKTRQCENIEALALYNGRYREVSLFPKGKNARMLVMSQR